MILRSFPMASVLTAIAIALRCRLNNSQKAVTARTVSITDFAIYINLLLFLHLYWPTNLPGSFIGKWLIKLTAVIMS